MALLSAIGDWLQGSGWTVAISTAKVTTEGRADNLLKGHDTAHSQWAHQVSAAALHHLLTESYLLYQQSFDENDLSFVEWREHMETMSPQFFYWSKTLDIEILFLQFLRAQREANFQRYTYSDQNTAFVICN